MSYVDASWLNFWEWFSAIGFVFVIAGCVMEGVEHFIKFKKGESKKRHTLEKYGWFILVGGLAMEFLGDHRAKRIASKEDARLTNEAGQAHERAEHANERAEILESTNKVLATQLATIESTNLVLRSNVAELDTQVVETKIQLAKANERTALTESNNLVLRTEVAELEIQLSKTDPLNLPIVLATAEVSFFVFGKNSLKGWHTPKNEI